MIGTRIRGPACRSSANPDTPCFMAAASGEQQRQQRGEWPPRTPPTAAGAVAPAPPDRPACGTLPSGGPRTGQAHAGSGRLGAPRTPLRLPGRDPAAAGGRLPPRQATALYTRPRPSPPPSFRGGSGSGARCRRPTRLQLAAGPWRYAPGIPRQ